jgi:uncharacterized protein DUF488
MKTSCGLTYRGPGRIAICRMYLKFPAGFKAYRPLAPGRWFHSVDYPEYYRRYRKQLDKLDPELVLQELKALAVPHQPVLLCWEEPPLHREKWCHRAIVARWFWETIGLEVRERYYGLHKSPNWKRVPPHTTGRAKARAVAPARARQLEARA